MALYAIGDLHLCLGAPKPMDVFGGRWNDYMERIKENWNSTVSDADTVIVGKVPDAYTKIEKLDSDTVGDVIDFAADVP